ncbi:MAG: DUF885 family protein [Saprospirales bacterium]|nr:MAG: DUF885 family protein [Saprospirales bacterium]
MGKCILSSVFVMLLMVMGSSAVGLDAKKDSGGELPDLMRVYIADRGALDRKYTLRYSEEYYDRMWQLAGAWKERLDGIDYEGMGLSDKIDYHLFRNHLEKRQFDLQLAREGTGEVIEVIDFAGSLKNFIRDRRRGNSPNSRAVADAFHEAGMEVKKRIDKIDSKDKFKTWQQASRASDVVDDLRENLEWAFDFYDLYHPDFSWWVAAPWEKLSDKLTNYATALKGHYDESVDTDDGSGIFGRPLGAEALEREIHSEMIPYTARELIEMARREFEWCQEQLSASAAKLGYEDYMDAIEYVKTTSVAPGEQPALINYFAEEAIEFLEERNLLTVPELAKETWRMRMLSPEMQRIAPFFLGGEQVQVAFPTSTMEHDLKMMSLRGNNPHFSRAVVHHELIPGHHLQQFMNSRYQTHRRPFMTPFWIEGWALYWEMLLWEKDFARNAEDEIGMLFWRIHRNARIIFSLKYHLGEMSPQECIDFLVEKVGHERANAEAEVRRSFEGAWGPLYQISYMVGGLQMMALREELVESGRMEEKTFHDRILRENGMPIELLRALLLEKPPERDFESSWKFIELLNR